MKNFINKVATIMTIIILTTTVTPIAAQASASTEFQHRIYGDYWLEQYGPQVDEGLTYLHIVLGASKGIESYSFNGAKKYTLKGEKTYRINYVNPADNRGVIYGKNTIEITDKNNHSMSFKFTLTKPKKIKNPKISVKKGTNYTEKSKNYKTNKAYKKISFTITGYSNITSYTINGKTYKLKTPTKTFDVNKLVVGKNNCKKGKNIISVSSICEPDAEEPYSQYAFNLE